MAIALTVRRNPLWLICIAMLGCVGRSATTSPSRDGATDSGKEPSLVLLAAGDIADCDRLDGARTTARILGNMDGTVAALGDLAYPKGTVQQFHDCYDATWGVYKNRTRPAPGNHEYYTPAASPYFEYFGSAAGNPGEGYYSYDLGGWHIVVLNSNCDQIKGCGTASPQERWLQDDLVAHHARCILAYWHHPLFSSGMDPRHARADQMRAIWWDLYKAGTTIVLNGHEHYYERFAPQDPDGNADPKGIREFVVGTGGAHWTPYAEVPIRNSEVRNTGEVGVLKLVLHADSYDWEFIGDPSGSFHDSGSGRCNQ